MIEAAVIGKPISHSLSPAIFGFLANQKSLTGNWSEQGRELSYRAREVGPEDLRSFIRSVRENEHAIGLNVTIPHKEAVMNTLDEISPEAQAVGAVNVVHRTKGRLFGHNTDVYGILRTFQKHRFSPAGKVALLIGAGGAARAVAYALGKEKAQVVIVLSASPESSSVTRAKGLADEMTRHFPNTQYSVAQTFQDVGSGPLDLVVQSTPLGMPTQLFSRDGKKAPDFYSGLRSLSFSPNAWGFDLIYKPENTPFLRVAGSLGLKAMGGLDMLVGQALETWKIWFGQDPGSALHEELSHYLRNRPIFLTGFMGAGKSTVGPILARLLGWNFFESDHAIEEKAGMKIARLFVEKGEPHFRELEHQVIRENAFSPRTVISLGGGAITHAATRAMLVSSGRLVFLSADPKTLSARLRSSAQKRPLLAGLSDSEREKKIESLLQERQALYDQSVYQIDTASLSPEQAAHQIKELLQ